MGCTTSVVLLEGLRSILQRNCSYVKGAVELGALEEDEETLSFRGSHLWIPTTVLVSPVSRAGIVVKSMLLSPTTKRHGRLLFFFLASVPLFVC